MQRLPHPRLLLARTELKPGAGDAFPEGRTVPYGSSPVLAAGLGTAGLPLPACLLAAPVGQGSAACVRPITLDGPQERRLCPERICANADNPDAGPGLCLTGLGRPSVSL